MRFITEIREKIRLFWEVDNIHLANVERLYSHSAKTERGYSQMEEKPKEEGERKPINPRFTNLPESAYIAFDVSRNTQILSQEPVRPTKPKEDKLLGSVKFEITQQQLLEHLFQVVICRW